MYGNTIVYLNFFVVRQKIVRFVWFFVGVVGSATNCRVKFYKPKVKRPPAQALPVITNLHKLPQARPGQKQKDLLRRCHSGVNRSVFGRAAPKVSALFPYFAAYTWSLIILLYCGCQNHQMTNFWYFLMIDCVWLLFLRCLPHGRRNLKKLKMLKRSY